MNSDDCDPVPPSSSAVRQKALSWHDDVRRVLRCGLRAVSVARGASVPNLGELQASAADIVAVVGRQVHAESELLAPVLATLDAWGPQRVGRLHELHDREHSAAASTLVEGEDIAQIALGIEKAVREILRALRIEEKELLDEEMLDDTTIVAQKQFGG